MCVDSNYEEENSGNVTKNKNITKWKKHISSKHKKQHNLERKRISIPN